MPNHRQERPTQLRPRSYVVVEVIEQNNLSVIQGRCTLIEPNHIRRITNCQYGSQMALNIKEYLTVWRGYKDDGRPKVFAMNNDAEIIHDCAIRGSFDDLERTCREFIKDVYKDGGPDVLHLYDTGVSFALYNLLRAWQIWHESTGNSTKGLTLFFKPQEAESWIPYPWFNYRPE